MGGKLGVALRRTLAVTAAAIAVTGGVGSAAGPAAAATPSSIAVVASANPSVFGESVTFTATVTCPASTPSGTATFFDGATMLGSAALDAGGQATLATSALAVATHPITAAYSGDTSCDPSTSAELGQVVDQASTTTTVLTSVNPSVFGELVTSTATVAAVLPGAGTPTGTVSFFDGVTLLGTGTLDVSGQATFTTSALVVGSHSVTASYGADASFAASTSSPVTQVVDQASTTTTALSSANPSVFGQGVTFTATVAVLAPGAGIPTGTVTFLDGVTSLATVALDGAGQASFTTSALAVGGHSMTAAYAGNASFVASTSSAVTQVVGQAGTTTTVVSWADPSTFGQSVTFTAVVAAVLPGAGTPTGSVTFFDGVATLGAATLGSAGQASLTTSTLAVGSHSLSALYAGDASFVAGGSPVLPQTVIAAAASATVDASLNPSASGQDVTFTATVAGNGPVPTGTVTFLDGGASIGAGNLDASGHASLTLSTLTSGAHQITASYGGDAIYPTSATASALTQEVAAASIVGTSTAASATTSSMARTGANPGPSAVLGLGLLTVGALAVSGARRRRRLGGYPG